MKRLAMSFTAAALAGSVLPLATASTAHADAAQPFTGFATSGWAAPVKLEIYEPTIPIPASPQLEVEFGYTAVSSDSGISQGRASWLWPGDSVGEGFKTFITALGLPEQLGEKGYPVQVNSSQPSGAAQQSDEPFPGTVMRTGSTPDRTYAEVGFSPDGDVSEPPSGDGGGSGGGGGGGVPGLPGLPGVPTVAGAPAPGAPAPASADDPGGSGAPGVPPEVAALVDFSGYTSSTISDPAADLVRTTSRSAVSEVSLLGGVITIAGVHTQTVTTSDGKTGKAVGTSKIGTLAIAGNEFTVGPDGVEAAGHQAPIPGLPDDPAKALKQLGITLSVPKPELTRKGDEATSLVQGLQVTIDTKVLRDQLDSIPFDDIVAQVPDEAGQLKSLLGAAVHLAPKFVITLGNAATATDTVQGIPTPTTPPTPIDDGSGGGGGQTTGGGTSGGAAPPSATAPGAPATGSPGSPSADGDLTDAAPMGSGLPPLFSIPGALLFGGLALAAAGGSYFRKLGMLALGGIGSCPHGLDSGLPDLRKA